MKRRQVISTLLAGALVLPAVVAAQPGPGGGGGPGYGPGQGKGPGAGGGPGYGPGAGQGPGMGGGPQQGRWTRERMYGSPLMTLEERQEQQRRMWNAKTVEERQKIRDEHRKLMQERATQQKFKIDEKQDDVYSVPAIPK